MGLDPVGVEDMRTSLYPSVTLIGVKTESAGVEEFIDRKFFAGDLFIDNKREVYKKLGFKRMGMMSLPKAVFAKKSRIAVAKVKKMCNKEMGLDQFDFRQNLWILEVTTPWATATKMAAVLLLRPEEIKHFLHLSRKGDNALIN